MIKIIDDADVIEIFPKIHIFSLKNTQNKTEKTWKRILRIS
jgi:hypothetical protein